MLITLGELAGVVLGAATVAGVAAFVLVFRSRAARSKSGRFDAFSGISDDSDNEESGTFESDLYAHQLHPGMYYRQIAPVPLYRGGVGSTYRRR